LFRVDVDFCCSTLVVDIRCPRADFCRGSDIVDVCSWTRGGRQPRGTRLLNTRGHSRVDFCRSDIGFWWPNVVFCCRLSDDYGMARWIRNGWKRRLLLAEVCLVFCWFHFIFSRWYNIMWYLYIWKCAPMCALKND